MTPNQNLQCEADGTTCVPETNQSFCCYLKNSNHGNINIKPEVLGDGVIVNCFFRGAWRIEFVSLLMLQGCCLFFRSPGGAHQADCY